MRSVELFAGVGGLALGVSKAGFRHEAVIEIDPDACKTIRLNQQRNLKPVTEWPLHEADVRSFEMSGISGRIDLLAAGVPCQPWSLGGKHRGYQDERNLFPDTVSAISILKPKAILIENVKGLLRESFASYFEYITMMVRYPEVTLKAGESWTEHLVRLQRHQTCRCEKGLEYKVLFQLLNSADYGIPQKRERVFVVAFRSDLGIEWSFPRPSHSQDVLLREQWVTAEYWDRHKVPRGERRNFPKELKIRLERTRSLLPLEAAWRTVRDAIHDLPDPESHFDREILNHEFNPGARSYPGHTGSPLDEPSKTLKAGDHGVPGGENMLRLPDGRVRYLTIRESARIQTFPDNFAFQGSWTETMRQLGNAVPVDLAEVIASDIKRHLSDQAARPFSQCAPKPLTIH